MVPPAQSQEQADRQALITFQNRAAAGGQGTGGRITPAGSLASSTNLAQALTLHKQTRTVKPAYHPPWKLVRVISGHLGWVRSVAVEPGNKWFATGAGDRVIKVCFWHIAVFSFFLLETAFLEALGVECGLMDYLLQIWDLASGELKLSLTGHISTVRGLAVSARHPYLFSAAEDKVSISCD